MKVFLKLTFLFIFLSHYTSIAGISSLDKIDSPPQKGATPSENVYFASTLKEFVNALGHDRKIVVTEDIYIEENLIVNEFSEFFEYDIVLIVKNARNLTITTNNSSSIIIKQAENEVVRFNNLTNFTLLNVSIFHEIETDGGCGEFAPVISFYDSSNIVVDHCKLNGSGTEGIHTNKVTDLLIKNTEVFNCNKRGFSFENSTGITIRNSKIYENYLDADSTYDGGPCIFYLSKSEVSVEKTSILLNSSHTEARYSILENNSTITFKECYVADNENFLTSSDILATSVDKPIEPIKSDDPIYQQFKSYYVTAKSGLNYRATPKGKLLGKFSLNTKVTVIEYPKVLDQITDEGKIVKGEWVGVQNKQDTVYVFNAFLSQDPVELHLKIYNLSPYDNQPSNPPNGEVRTAFVNISETYVENKKYDYLINQEELTDTVTLNPSLRKRFLKTVNITEEETIFIYDIDADAIHTYNVKDMPVIACPNIYGYDSAYGEDNYEFGFDLGKLDISYDNFVYIGKENPFQTNKIKPIIWKEIDTKKFPKKFDINIVDEDIRFWFDGYTPERSFKFTHNNLTYYIQNLEKDENVNYRYILVFKGKNIIYEDVYISSESSHLNPLTIENEETDYELYQFTGEIFKGKPSVLFGFLGHSFGCPSIDFLSDFEPAIWILCDNRH